MLQLYTGNGKGKTTAAAGLCVRAAGWAKPAVFAQFLKGTKTGEVISLEQLGVRVFRDNSTVKFVFQMSDDEKSAYRISQRAVFDSAVNAAANAEMLVLDEIGDAVSIGIIEESALLDFLKSASPQLEIILTGRSFSPEICALADYHSEIVSRRHPYDRKIPARKGIEY